MKVSKSSAIFGLLFCCSPLASAEIFEVEGPIQSVTANMDGSGSLMCNGVTIQIPAGTPISSPTASLGIADLALSTAFPSRDKNGFIGGTCIVNGNNDFGPNQADKVFAEIAENVLLGSVTSNDPDPFKVLGVEFVPLEDFRMPFGGATNQFGFEVFLATVPLGDLSVGEGYFGMDGRLYVHTVETTAGMVMDPTPRASIQRAQCENQSGTGKDKLEVRGGVILPNGTPGSVSLCQVGASPSSTCVGSTFSAPVTADPEFPGFGTYRLSRSNLTFSACQPRVKADYQGVSTFAELKEIPR